MFVFSSYLLLLFGRSWFSTLFNLYLVENLRVLGLYLVNHKQVFVICPIIVKVKLLVRWAWFGTLWDVSLQFVFLGQRTLKFAENLVKQYLPLRRHFSLLRWFSSGFKEVQKVLLYFWLWLNELIKKVKLGYLNNWLLRTLLRLLSDRHINFDPLLLVLLSLMTKCLPIKLHLIIRSLMRTFNFFIVILSPENWRWFLSDREELLRRSFLLRSLLDSVVILHKFKDFFVFFFKHFF